MLTVLTGDSLEQLRTLPDASVQCCVTSPPYWGLRDYGVAGQLGLEKTPEEYVAKMVQVFREVRRVLKDDGTCWINLGDSYANDSKWGGSTGGKHVTALHGDTSVGRGKKFTGLKGKDLVGIPWMVAFALRADGWYLRQDIIWAKPNPMPESVTDRCTKAHEYIFLLSKSQRYFYDAEAIQEPSVSDHDSGNGFAGRQGGASHLPMSGGQGTAEQWRCRKRKSDALGANGRNVQANGSEAERRDKAGSFSNNPRLRENETRNKRSVWTVTTQSYSEAHFATFPPDLIKPCVLAGSKPGDVVLDPFAGSGTTGMVALELGRRALLIELNPAYVKLIEQRCNVTPGLALA